MLGCGGINFFEVFQNGGDGIVEAIEIQAIDPDFAFGGDRLIVVGSEPTHEVEHVAIPPHPLREALESRQRFGCSPIAVHTFHKLSHAPGIRPIGLQGESVEALLGDQAPRDLGPRLIKLVCSVCGLAQ